MDSKGNIYIGDRYLGLFQVFNERGEYLYGFYTGITNWEVFDIDSQDKLHIGIGKGHGYEVIFEGELLKTKELNYEQEIELKKSFRSSRSKVFKTDKKIYKYSFLNKVVVSDTNKSEKNTIRLPLPLWPWPVYVYFMLNGLGVASILSGTMVIIKLEEYLQRRNSF